VPQASLTVLDQRHRLPYMRAAVAFGAAFILLAVADPVAQGAFPGANGEIAFVRGGAIWAVNADGNGLRQVTHPKKFVNDDSISWSPDGLQLAFVRIDYGDCGIPCNSVETVRSDGTGMKEWGQSSWPRWSPDGTRLVSASYLGANRYATTVLETTSLRTRRGVVLAPRALRGARDTILRFGYEIGDYAWSPNGARICFSRKVGVQPWLLALVRPNGAGLALLAALRGFDCAWDPTSRRVVFTNGRKISTVGIDGSGLEPLTDQSGRELAPVFSPDGTTIVFLRQEAGGKNPPYDLWRMAADGSGQTMIATDVSLARWSPDGTLIAFIRGGRPSEDGFGTNGQQPRSLWLTHPDGSAQAEIAAGATEFDWQARSP
jgi:Tol biopolymer transport system component